MKNYLYLIIALFAASCGSTDTKDYLTTLTQQRDSLKTEYRALGAELAKIELQISKLDTTHKKVNVTLAEAQHTKFAHYFKVYGSVNADNNTLVYPSTQGEITSLLVEEGQPVKKGQVLLTIDSEIIKSNIEEVKKQRELAAEVYQKQSKLWEKKIGSEIDYLQAKNNLESLDKRLETLQTQLSKTKITAPFSGTIDEIFVKSGQLIGPQVGTMRIINLDQVYLKAEIPENYINVISKGSSVHLSFPSIDLELDTKIQETGKFINPSNRTFTVRVDLDNQNGKLYPNLLGLLEIQDYVNDSALVIPTSIIQEDANGNSFIFVAHETEEGIKSELQYIQVGMTYEGITEITDGVTPGQKIIDKGSRNVSNGQIIQVVK